MTAVPPNTFKRRLADGTPQLGFWLALNSLAATEIAASAGFDWLLLDMEHAALDIESVERHLYAARYGGDPELVVRVPSLDPVLVKRLLDSGIRSFMFPFVQTVPEARLAVASTRYPPAGIRGFSGSHRGNRFGRDAAYPEHAHEEICVIIQIESPLAVATIPQFGEIDGLDAMLIGPNDLAANMGLVGQARSQPVRDKIAEALALMLPTGKAPGILNYDPPTARALLRDGFRLAAIGGDVNTLLRGLESLLAAIRATPNG